MKAKQFGVHAKDSWSLAHREDWLYSEALKLWPMMASARSARPMKFWVIIIPFWNDDAI